MKQIVVLDGSVANPGDLTWDPLHELGEVIIHDRTEPAEIIDRALLANIVFCLLYTSPSPRDQRGSRMPSSA